MIRIFTNTIAILMFWSLLLSCSTPVINEKQQEEVVKHPDHESWDVKITITDAGLIRAYIEADYLQQYNDENFTKYENNVKINFFNTEEKSISRLTADFAEINERANFLQAQSNVIVESDSGVTLYTDTLSWDETKEVIFTNDLVMITTETQDTIYGVGFESDMTMEHWKILKPRGVTGR